MGEADAETVSRTSPVFGFYHDVGDWVKGMLGNFKLGYLYMW